MTDEAFSATGLSVRFGAVQALSQLTATIETGEMVGVAGPNGAGKSTLLRVLAGLETGWTGSVSLLGRPLREWKRPAIARRTAYVAQQTRIIFPYTAREIVLMGRLPLRSSHFFETDQDRAAVQAAMEETGCHSLAERVFHTLSGGEQQLVILASALSQQPDILLLDEPTAFLDLRHQLQIGGILSRLHRDGMTVVMATHDLRLAESLSNRMLLIKQGQLVAEVAGAASSQSGLTASIIADLFDLDPADVAQAEGGRIQLRFRS